MVNKCVCLLSGGLDSTTVAVFAKSRGYECHALSFDYGQRHRKELECALNIANRIGVEHKIIRINLGDVAYSALTGHAAVDKREISAISASIPNTYVPSRNIVFLSVAASYAESIGAREIFIGANAIDYSGYPDCRPEFFNSFELALNSGTRAGDFRIRVPLQYLSKRDIVKLALKLEAPLELTTSCYEGEGLACGHCDSCQLRLRGFMESGVKDPIRYSSYPEFYKKWLEKNSEM